MQEALLKSFTKPYILRRMSRRFILHFRMRKRMSLLPSHSSFDFLDNVPQQTLRTSNPNARKLKQEKRKQ